MRRPCFPNSDSHQHGPPLLGRVRTPPRSPASTLLCSPPTPSSPSAAAPVVPRQRPTSVRRLVLHRRTGASADRCNAGDISTPAPHKPALSRGETRGSQVPGPSSSCVPWSTTPPGAYRPSPISRCGRCCLQATQCLRHPEACFFRGYLPTAHSLACLRFAESVTVSGARLATGRAGSPLAGRVSHPLDDKQGFMGSSHTPFPLDQPCLVALGPRLIIASECLHGEGAPHCQDTTPVLDTISRAETTRARIGGFGRASAASEWLARHAAPIACRSA